MEVISDKPRLARLLDHFSALADAREPWRVAYPLPEMLLLVVCGTIAACDDYDDIRDWGEAHLGFLRRFLPYHHGLPCADWLRTPAWCTDQGCGRTAPYPVRVRRGGRSSGGPGPACD